MVAGVVVYARHSHLLFVHNHYGTQHSCGWLRRWSMQEVLHGLSEALTSIAACRVLTEIVFSTQSGYRRLLNGLFSSQLFAAYLLFQLMMNMAAPQQLPASLMLRFILLTGFHTVACAIDTAANVSEESWRASDFARHLLRASLYVAPAWPLLVVAGSTLLMACTAVFEHLFHLASLKWLIDLGSLHAPFFFIHMHTKRSMCGRRRTDRLPLPLHAGPEGAATPSLQREDIRRQRLLRLNPTQ